MSKVYDSIEKGLQEALEYTKKNKKENSSCDYEDDCQNKTRDFTNLNCYACRHFKDKRLDLYLSKDKIKQSVYDEIHKNDKLL